MPALPYGRQVFRTIEASNVTTEPEIIPPGADDDAPYPNRFKIGDGRAGPGRPPGTPNRTTRLLREAVIAAGTIQGDILRKGEISDLRKRIAKELKKNGREGEAVPDLPDGVIDAEGLTRYLVFLAQKHPRSFAQLLGRVMPLQLAGEFKVAPTDALSRLMEQVNGRTRSIEK